MSTEEQRAAEHRRVTRARARQKKTAEKRLAGNPAARRALEEKTKALLTVDENGVRRGDVHC